MPFLAMHIIAYVNSSFHTSINIKKKILEMYILTSDSLYFIFFGRNYHLSGICQRERNFGKDTLFGSQGFLLIIFPAINFTKKSFKKSFTKQEDFLQGFFQPQNQYILLFLTFLKKCHFEQRGPNPIIPNKKNIKFFLMIPT